MKYVKEKECNYKTNKNKNKYTDKTDKTIDEI